MVRINLISPSKLADQHLIAEYNEILMLFGYVRKFPKLGRIPEKYCLGPGHIKFFKNKLSYLKKRHELIKLELRKRGFKTEKTIKLDEFPDELKNDWISCKEDENIIKARLREKILKKPDFYTYYSEKKGKEFFLDLLE